MQKVDVSHYTYRVSWSAEDSEYVATCAEFASLSWLADTQIGALEGIEALVADVVDDLLETGERIPGPIAERKFSGTFNVRIGEELHRRLVLGAAEEKLSLNQYVVKKLAAT